MLTFLSNDYSGILIALLTGFTGLGVVLVGRKASTKLWSVMAKASGGIVLAVSVLLGVGATFQLAKTVFARSANPPPGRLIDVGGYQMHIMAEGAVTDKPTVVWLSGKHDQGLLLNHLHKATARTNRSILFDRPGSGWSDTGPFPRSVETEAKELHTLLEKSGEKGPYVLVPWSFSGLLAVTFAELFPEDTGGLVLLDVTSANFVHADQQNINAMCRRENKSAWLARFGLWDPIPKLTEDQLAYYRNLYAPIADVQDIIFSNNDHPRFFHTTCSALNSAAYRSYGSTQIAGALGSTPLFAIFPADFELEAQGYVASLPGFSEFEKSKALRSAESRKSDLAQLSNQGEIRIAPQNTTHSLPFEAPDYVLQQVREMIDRVSRRMQNREVSAQN